MEGGGRKKDRKEGEYKAVVGLTSSSNAASRLFTVPRNVSTPPESLASVLPFELVMPTKGWMQIAMYRRFFRAKRLFAFEAQADNRFVQSPTWPALKLLTYLLFLIHVLGCSMYMIREAEGTLEYHLSVEERHPGDSSAYAIVIYDALLTILGEKIDAVYTTNERIFFTCTMLLGAVFNAILFGQVALAVTGFQRSTLRYQEKMANVAEHMKSLRLPRDVQRRVSNFYDYMWHRNQCLEQDEFLSEVSSTLTAEISLFRHRELIHNVAFLRVIPEPACVVKLCLSLETHFYLPGDFIVKEGEYGEEMYMLASGVAEVLVNNKCVRTFNKNAFFGEMALMTSDKLRRTATIRATAYSELVSLAKPKFLQVMSEYPLSKKQVYAVINKQIGSDISNKSLPSLIEKGLAFDSSINALSVALNQKGLEQALSSRTVKQTVISDKGIFEVTSNKNSKITRIKKRFK